MKIMGYWFLCGFFFVGGLHLLSCSGQNEKLKMVKAKTFFRKLARSPENLHPIRSTDYYSSIVHNYILESLLERDKDTYEWRPGLAKKWEASSDGKTFTFELYDHLKWSDGKDLTVQDVKFSFEAYRDPKYGGIRRLPYFEKMESVKILSSKKIQFIAKEPYFGNFEVIAKAHIIPEHIYKDPKTKLSKTVIGSGPYRIEKYIRDKVLILNKNPLWRGQTDPLNKGRWNFQTIAFRFVLEETDALLRVEKGHLDYTSLSPLSFFERTNSPLWNTKIRKVEYRNKEPSSYGYIGFNFKNPIFKDKKVRRALAHLLNRELINKKFHYNQMELARGPWYFWSDYAHPRVKVIDFNPQKAMRMLKSAGWSDKDKNGILEKRINGIKKELAFSILFSHPRSEKYLTLYKEDLKQAGVELSLKKLDWVSFLEHVRGKKFDTILLNWSGSIDVDPKQIWHTESTQNQGSNYISYSNSLVDILIEKGRAQLNREERIKTFQKVYKIIAEDTPYIFLFNRRNYFYAVSQRIHTPVDTFNYDVGLSYWSLKEAP